MAAEMPPLTKAEKSFYLAKFKEALKDNEALKKFFDFIFEAIKNEKKFEFSDPLQRFVKDLGAPYSHFSNDIGEEDQVTSYNTIVRSLVLKKAVDLFISACEKPEPWSDETIHSVGKTLGVQILSLPYIVCAIHNGKVYWRLLQNGNLLAWNQKPAPLNLNYTMMTMEEFISFKAGGKRNISKRNPNKIIPYIFNGACYFFDLRRINRNPKKKFNFDHNNPKACHTCLWDVDLKKDLTSHKHAEFDRGCTLHDMSKNKEDALKLDHVPSSKHILQRNGDPVKVAQTKLKIVMSARAYTESTLFESSKETAETELKTAKKKATALKESGYTIATLSMWHDATRTFKDKNLLERPDEIIQPDKAIRLDILWYFVTLSKNKMLSLQVVGAFRYLYKLNLVRDHSYASLVTDTLLNVGLLAKNGGVDMEKLSDVADEVYRPFLFGK